MVKTVSMVRKSAGQMPQTAIKRPNQNEVSRCRRQPRAGVHKFTDPRLNNASVLDVWTAFVNEIEANGVLGEFTLRGVTDDLWAGIPAGLEYTAVHSTMLTKDRTRLIQTHMWMAEDGTVISSGSQVTYYDPKTARIKRSQSGFDMGELFYGTSKLVRSGATQEWIYTEHSRGKVTDYRIISKSIDWDNMELSYGLADGSSAMTTLKMQRVD